jgi:glycosyltransferase involved in cell wall biosynthesis
MKVAHFIATLDLGGAEKQLLTLCREQVQNHYKVVVFPLKGANSLVPEFKSVGVEVSLNLTNRNSFVQYWRMLGLICRLQGYLFHAHSAKSQLLLSMLPIKTSIRLLISKHDAMPFIARVPRLVSRISWSWVQFRSARIVFISNAIREAMNGRREHVDPKKDSITYYGISKEEVEQIKNNNRQTVRQSWGLQENCLVVGTVGRLVKEKNQEFLLNVFRNFLLSNPSATLVINGYGPLELQLRRKIRSLKLESKVILLTDGADAKKVYSGFDLFVLPSLTEGFGLVLLEAMSANLPIIASKAGAIPEVLGKDYKFLFNPLNQDELLNLLVASTSEVSRDLLRTKSRERLEEFTAVKMFTRMDAIYRSLSYSSSEMVA